MNVELRTENGVGYFYIDNFKINSVNLDPETLEECDNLITWIPTIAEVVLDALDDGDFKKMENISTDVINKAILDYKDNYK